MAGQFVIVISRNLLPSNKYPDVENHTHRLIVYKIKYAGECMKHYHKDGKICQMVASARDEAILVLSAKY